MSGGGGGVEAKITYIVMSCLLLPAKEPLIKCEVNIIMRCVHLSDI